MEDLKLCGEAIKEAKSRLRADLLILVHHYQRRELIPFADCVGDSLVLARKAAESRAAKIVLCGVHFMAESARLLTRPEQTVYMPDPRAGCPMADMADAMDVQAALDELARRTPARRVVPVVYVNSSAEVKAVAGRRGGIACTSSSARDAVEWARKNGNVILFLPDRHLGGNTARRVHLEPVHAWNPHLDAGGLSKRDLEEAAMITWPGYCHVHTFFTVDHVKAARSAYPGCRVIVHPECHAEVVEAADMDGSTEYIVRAVANSDPGETVVVGTEINLVSRLAQEYPWVNVVPLAHSLCPNMYRTTPAKLAALLQSFDPRFEITVPPAVAADALLPLKRMLNPR